jgi:hypothetical protein
MLYINILTKVNYPSFEHQLDHLKFDKAYKFFENSEKDIIWDIVIVYEGCKKPQKIKHKQGGLVFISGEPPLSRVYPKEFAMQFDLFITTHKNIITKKIKNHQLAINWHFGLSFKTKIQKYNFQELVNLRPPSKEKLFSIVTSSKKMMPGHNYRQKLIKNLKQDFGDLIDFYGDGVNNVEYKSSALLPYKFHICLENSIIQHYWSEKFSDPLLGYAIPIYAGCPNIDEYYGTEGYFKFDLKKYEELKFIIDKIVKDPQNIYQEMLPDFKILRNKLLFEYNFYNVIDDVIKNNEIILKESVLNTTLIPYEYCKSYKVDYLKMRLKRLVVKLYINIFK